MPSVPPPSNRTNYRQPIQFSILHPPSSSLQPPVYDPRPTTRNAHKPLPFSQLHYGLLQIGTLSALLAASPSLHARPRSQALAHNHILCHYSFLASALVVWPSTTGSQIHGPKKANTKQTPNSISLLADPYPGVWRRDLATQTTVRLVRSGSSCAVTRTDGVAAQRQPLAPHPTTTNLAGLH